MKKFLTALLIGAFVFGVGTADMNFASAKSAEKTVSTQAKDKAQQKLDGDDMKKPPEPPKDSNGNPLPPPDKDKNSDGKDRPEPPKDSDGNHQPPTNMSDNDKTQHQKK